MRGITMFVCLCVCVCLCVHVQIWVMGAFGLIRFLYMQRVHKHTYIEICNIYIYIYRCIYYISIR